MDPLEGTLSCVAEILNDPSLFSFLVVIVGVAQDLIRFVERFL